MQSPESPVLDVPEENELDVSEMTIIDVPEENEFDELKTESDIFRSSLKPKALAVNEWRVADEKEDDSMTEEEWKRLGFTMEKNTKFEPFLVFLFGPTTNSMVLSFFFSNPYREFSKEDVFAYLNKWNDDSGIDRFFFESIGFRPGINNKIGRNTVARTIDNLVKNNNILQRYISESATSDSSETTKRRKYVLNLKGDINHVLRDMAPKIWKSEKYKEFEEFRLERKERRDRNREDPADLSNLIADYFTDIYEWNPSDNLSFSHLYKKKDTRLVDYCEANNLNWSTTNRTWSEYINPRDNIENSILWPATKPNLWKICRKLESSLPKNPNCSKKEMIEIIIKNVI